MDTSFSKRHPLLKDVLSLLIFAFCVFIGTVFINQFIFRSFNVEGPSMEKTLYTGDRLIVNQLPVTWQKLQNKNYIPERGQVIVFENPQYLGNNVEEFIVKRVIAFPGERVVLANGAYTVYNGEHPTGFNPDDANHGEPGSPTSGSVDVVVPEGELFVSGDHRRDNYSYDSRNGLGTIPFNDVIGPVAVRVFPFTGVRTF